MGEIKSIEDALERIEELEKEIAELKAELEYFKKRKASGRQKHNEKWMAMYNRFASYYEQGRSIDDIAGQIGISVRTIYRYKAYYDQLKKYSENK